LVFEERVKLEYPEKNLPEPGLKLGDALKSFKCVGNLPNKDSWTFNGLIFSHPGEFKRDLNEF